MKAILQTVAGNPENQDRGAVIECDSKIVLVIADGAGGLSGGSEAAAMAVNLVRQHVASLDGPDACIRLLQNVDREIMRDPVAGETTCVVAVVMGESVYGAGVGDSGACVIGEGGVKDLTEHQMRKPFLGTGRTSPVNFRHRLGYGEKLLLATDGLFKYTSRERLENVCRSSVSEMVPKQLIELVRYPSGALPDDVTIIFVVI